MEQGPTEWQILDACARRGVGPPEAIRNAPALLDGLDLYYDAFVDLHTCRVMGGMIPWTAVADYATRLGLDGEGLDVFAMMMREMDAEWGVRHAERTEREKSSGQPGRVQQKDG